MTLSRRRFLESAGFTLTAAAVNGCSRPPAELALPFSVQPEGVTPGQTKHYASTCSGCTAGCGLLVGVRDGRPLKMEGLPEHPLSRGGLCAVGQALPLELFDSHRLRAPLHLGTPSDWRHVDDEITQALARIADSGGAVRLVSSTVTSPTLQSTINTFLARFKDARHITLDPVSSSAILDAHEITHGVRLLPHYLLEQATVIASFGADFLGTWISPVEFTAAWSKRRRPTIDQPMMSYHVHFEGPLSLTGSNADRRFRLAPDEYSGVLHQLYMLIAGLSGEVTPSATGTANQRPAVIPHEELQSVAQQLWNARGRSVVLCDSQDVAVQVVVNAMNHRLGNYGQTLDIVRPSRQRAGNDRDVVRLINELRTGAVAALLVAGVDLTHQLPDREALAEAIGRVPLVVSFADRADDFASLAHFVCPEHHPLETWLDAEPVSGVISLSQPLLRPMGETRSVVESLARWSGRTESAYEILRSFWEDQILPRATATSFRHFWDHAVHDGFVNVAQHSAVDPEFNSSSLTLAASPVADAATAGGAVAEAAAEDGSYCLVLYPRIGLTDSRHAHNPWLQELPDPVTKVTWDNYVSVSTGTADTLKLTDGDVIRVAAPDRAVGVELPVLVQRGQHDRVISIALNYGVRGTDRFANIGPQWIEGRPTVASGELVGINAAPLIELRNDRISLVRSDVMLTKTGRRRDLASTQEHHSLEIPRNVAPHGAEVRDIVQDTTLAAFAENPLSGKPPVHGNPELQLWADDHPKSGHHWGMTIDLNACTGCSACLVACQSENNVPVVGKDEVRRQREMHWIRIDRYYAGEDDDLGVHHQPMMCQHCGNAPCETVCPVLATVHSDEGLNEQVYNRCVGTRYCANNCPYKVRRFNWFDYPREDSLLNLALNPDVTVRSRGVMEKCSLCVQRIEEARIAARRRGEPIREGDIRTACQQSCPASAIVFGDLNNEQSEVRTAKENPRNYGVLEEFNFQQTVSYLRVVRNRDDLQVSGDAHA